MSGFSGDTTCPNCNDEANLYSDYKPFEVVNIDCLECGFYTITSVHQMELDELNEMRADYELQPLKKLPQFKKERF